LKERLRLILTEQTPKRLTYRGWLAVALAAGLLLPLMPTLAQPEKKQAGAVPMPMPEAKTDAAPEEPVVPAPVVPDEESLRFDTNAAPLQGVLVPMEAVAPARDGRLLVTAGRRHNTPGEIPLWDATSGQLRQLIREATGVRTIALSPDGSLLA